MKGTNVPRSKPRKPLAWNPVDGKDPFMSNFRQALEHIGDTRWLGRNNPLESMQAGSRATPVMAPLALQKTGIAHLDKQLTAIWQDWERRDKTPVQHLLWDALRRLKPDGEPGQAPQTVLLLTYFHDPRPKQADVIKALAVSKATYYRHLDMAVGALKDVLLEQLGPSMQFEPPATRPMLGRDAALAHCVAMLRKGQVVAVSGASGFGKSLFGAHVAAEWGRRRVFWYALRPDITDNVSALVYALAYFLYQCGVPGLWSLLLADAKNVGTDKALAMIITGLESMQANPPLLCMDECDLLLPDELHERASHTQLRAFLEALAQARRHGAAMLLIGRRLLLEPDTVIALERFGDAELAGMLEQGGLALTPQQRGQLLAHTHGNPLLARLFITLHRAGEPMAESLAAMSGAGSLDWFLARIRSKLSAREIDVLESLSIYDAPAPTQFWHEQRKELDNLISLGLVIGEAASDNALPQHVSLHPALRDALNRRLPETTRIALHLTAADKLSKRGEFTAAARHFIAGRCPEMAVWIWNAHRANEIRFGHADAAFDIFSAIEPQQLAQDADRRAHALLVASLSQLNGNASEGLRALDAVSWANASVSGAQASEARANLLVQRGQIDQALVAYRKSLDAVDALSPAKSAQLNLAQAHRKYWFKRDAASAREDLLRAEHDVALLQGTLACDEGNPPLARDYFLRAIALADKLNSARDRAKAREELGCLEARLLNTERACQLLEETAQLYASYGNTVCAVGITNLNLSYAHVLARQYALALAPAQLSLKFGEATQQPFLIASNQANLAEAYFYLEDVEQAEVCANAVMESDEVSAHPYGLYVMAHVRRAQQRFPEAVHFARDAIAQATSNDDPWALGPAWRALALCHRAAGQHAQSQSAFEEVIRIYTRLGVDKEVQLARELARS